MTDEPGKSTAPPADASRATPADTQAEEALQAFVQAEHTREQAASSGAAPARPSLIAGFFRDFFKIWSEPTVWGRLLMSALCLGVILAIWFLVTAGGRSEARMVARTTIGTPGEVFGAFPSFWADADGDLVLLRHVMASFSRVLEGFVLALLVAVPLGVLCGTFRRIDAFFAPISIFFRNVPISALLPLTLIWFGIGESQKVGFIFIACFAFIMFSTAQAIAGVNRDYMDTAFTLGASRRQVVTKVLIPLALPDIFNSVRLLFGLAFGYIILAEMIAAESGLGKLILVSQRRGNSDHVYLSLLTITLLAFLLDRLLFLIQKQAFPYRYGTR
jgi:ABC-type nitrate/sulfonate/bicarbonate transport system permease component